MARFIHSVLAPQQTIAADGLVQYDLPVNPLSVIMIQLEPLNETSTITTFGLWNRLASALDLVEVLHKGAAMFSMSGADLMAYNYWVNGITPAQANSVNTDNDRRSITIPIILGRRAYDPAECFPRTKRGELELQCTWDIADTGFDALRISIETVELPEADPKFFQRLTTLSQTFAATGDNDINLPIGRILRGLLLFGTTGWAGATPAATLGRLSLLKDNLQTHYSLTRFENSRLIARLGARPVNPFDEHIHGGNFTTTVQGNTQFPQTLFPMMENYTHLDLDPTDDDLYSIETKGAGSLVCRVNADAANAARCIPIEKFDVAQLPQD